MTPNWHVLRTYYQREQRVVERLSTLLGVGNSFCPAVRSAAMHRGRSLTRITAAYSGYAFARWQASDGNCWRAIKDTYEVVDILGKENPWPMFPGVVEDWIARADDESVIPGLEPPPKYLNRGFSAGDHVRLTHGAFEYVLAYVDWMDGSGVHLQIKGLLSRDQGVYLPFISGATLVLDGDYKPQSKTQWRRRRRRVGSSEREAPRLPFATDANV